MKNSTFFPREERADVLFEKILHDPWACERLQETFCNYLFCNDEFDSSLSSQDFSEALFDAYQNKDLSAFQNVKMHANMYPNVDRKRIEHILDVVHLLPYKNDKAGKFSLGMKQRLGLAIAFVSNPDLIILDEPVNGLDIEGVVEIREIIKKLNAEKNVTFLISSHMAGEIEKTCNKVAVIYESELIATSTTEDALRLHPSMEDYFLSVVKDRRGEIII